MQVSHTIWQIPVTCFTKGSPRWEQRERKHCGTLKWSKRKSLKKEKGAAQAERKEEQHPSSKWRIGNISCNCWYVQRHPCKRWELKNYFHSSTCFLVTQLQLCVAFLAHVAIKKVFARQESGRPWTEILDAAKQENVLLLVKETNTTAPVLTKLAVPRGARLDRMHSVLAEVSAREVSSVLRYAMYNASWYRIQRMPFPAKSETAGLLSTF